MLRQGALAKRQSCLTCHWFACWAKKRDQVNPIGRTHRQGQTRSEESNTSPPTELTLMSPARTGGRQK
eukprot:5445368-Heterocapsa_arctica.AAC.1